MTHPFTPRAIGEIAIRCSDLDAMAAFYEDVIGLTRLSGNVSTGIIFLKVSDGYAGHTNVIALFHHSLGHRQGLHPIADTGPETGALSSLHHLALSLPYSEQDAVIAHYEAIGQAYRIEHFGWIGWRGIFTTDPEGNTVELVAYDAGELDDAGSG